MSPQIIPHFSATSSGGLTWDANMIAKNPYVIGLDGCVFRRVVDTIADLANISNPQLNDRALVWGADSTETKIYMWDGSTWGDMGQPLSNVQYIDSYSKESMFFYKVEPDTNNYIIIEAAALATQFSTDGMSVIGLVKNFYLIGSVSAYRVNTVSGVVGGAQMKFTNCTSQILSTVGLSTTITNYNIPIKTNGIFCIAYRNGGSVSGNVQAKIGFKAASN